MRFRRPVYDNEEVFFAVDAAENTYTIRGDDDMGPRSTGVFAGILGSIAQGLLRESTVPVLVVRPDGRNEHSEAKSED